MAELLKVRDLKTYFYRSDGVVKAVDGISYTLKYGQTLGLVGESGSGKSVSVLSLLGLLRSNGRIEGGEAIFDGRDLLKLNRAELREIRGKEIGMVFQDPMTSLNPTLTIGRQLIEPLIWHRVASSEEARARALELLQRVGIPEYRGRFFDYPFQFSGGMRQRVMIAMALACKPKLLIADEPTTALDVTVRAQILNLIQDMKEELNMSVIIITHDFGIATNFCDSIAVMYAGRIVEMAPTEEFIMRPFHPYSIGLMRSTLDIDVEDSRLEPIPGNPPNLKNPPFGCRFHPRCKRAVDICRDSMPELKEVADSHYVACHFAEGDGAYA
ncbi:MAG: ABC transporter ATP-binding protein [Firmicutes bacterium]|nr:ABC transporter ATP-binding protein [Bacillota bacterium]